MLRDELFCFELSVMENFHQIGSDFHRYTIKVQLSCDLLLKLYTETKTLISLCVYYVNYGENISEFGVVNPRQYSS